MYLKKTYQAGITIEIQKTYSARYGKNISRGAKVNQTPEAVKKYNEMMAFRELTRILNANYAPKDMHLTLNYYKGQRPEPKIAKKNLENFLRSLRKLYKDEEKELKRVALTAVGERGAIHHHLVINNGNKKAIRKLWKYGGVHWESLYPNGEYSALAWYLIKQTRLTVSGEPTGKKRWTCSKNLIRPEPKIEEIDAKTWREPPTPQKGYYIDKNSVNAGVSVVTGIPYLFYRMLPIPQIVRTPEDKILTGKAAEKYILKQNKEDVRNEWTRQTDGKRMQVPQSHKKRKRTESPRPHRKC